MNILKKSASILLALLLVVSLATPAFARTGDGTDGTSVNETKVGQVNVTLADAEVTDGATVTLYKIVDVIKSETADVVGMEWINAGLQEAIANHEIYGTDGWKANENPSNINSKTETEVAEFYQFVSQYVHTHTGEFTAVTEQPTSAKVGNSVMFTWDAGELETGLYLAVGSGATNIYRASVVNTLPSLVDGTNIFPVNTVSEAQLKASKPALDKTISDSADGSAPFGDDATVAFTDGVTFRVETEVPVYGNEYLNDAGNFSDVIYTMVDVYRSASFTMNAPTIKADASKENPTYPTTLTSGTEYTVVTDGTVYVTTSGGEEVPQFLVANGKYYDVDGVLLAANSVDTAKAELNISEEVTESTEYKSMVVVFDYDDIKDYRSIEYTFSATITEEGFEIGSDRNTNSANLVYSVDPADRGETKNIPDDVKAYSYAIDVTKRNGANRNELLGGAKFDLFKYTQTMTAAEYDALEEAAKANTTTVAQGDNVDVYTLFKTDLVTPAEDDEDAGVTKGILEIEGLDVGNYVLQEVEAPEGYSPLDGNILININVDNTADKAAGASTNQTIANGRVSVAVDNFQGVTLPSTGGEGTMLFTMVGITLMTGAMFFLLLKKRREEYC